MSFLLNRFRSSNGSDIELNDLEAGSTSANSTSVNNSAYPGALSNMEPTSREDGGRSAISTYRQRSSTTSTNPPLSAVPYSFSLPNTRSDGDDPMPMTSEIPRLLPPVEIYSHQGSAMKRPHKGVEREIADKVRIVEQAGSIPHKRVVQMNQKISQEYGDQFRQELAKQRALLTEQMEEAARRIEEANKRALESIVSASARAEEAERRACVRAEEAIAEASARAVESANGRLEMLVNARAEEIEHRASEHANKAITIQAEEAATARLEMVVTAQAEESGRRACVRAEEAIAEASARAVESANARLEMIVNARAEEIERQACVRAEEAIAEASARAVESANAQLEMIVNARAEEIERQACVRAEEAIAEASARAVESANARLEMIVTARAEEIEHRASERVNKAITEASIQAEEAANARAARAEEAAHTRAQDIERREERTWEKRYNKAMESAERFRMMFEEKINYASGPMNVDQRQQVIAEAELLAQPELLAQEVNQAWRGLTPVIEEEIVAQSVMGLDNEHASEGQGPMEVADELPEARNTGNSESVSESIRRKKRGSENVRPAPPPPQRFAPPRGGGGPGPFQMSAPQRQHREGDSDQDHPSGTHQPNPILNSNRQRSRNATRMKGVKALYTREGYDSSDGDDDDVVREALKRRHPSRKARVFQRTPLRGFDSERAHKMTSVRVTMNELLGIKKDDDICDYIGATAEEVESYHAGTGAAPVLQPMRLYLEKKQCVTWNDELSELFLDHYEQELDQQLTPDQRSEVEEFFENRVQQLGRKWREFRKNGVVAVIAKKEARASNDRANTRRAGLYDDRMLICLGNVTNPDGSRNEKWFRRLRMVKQLEANGMSSDESENQDGHAVYVVKKRAWRSDQVNDEVREIDNDRNTTNAHGGRRAGNTPRERIRLLRPNVSKRDPTLCCPENYYHRAFIANLNNRALRELDMCKSQNI